MRLAGISKRRETRIRFPAKSLEMCPRTLSQGSVRTAIPIVRILRQSALWQLPGLSGYSFTQFIAQSLAHTERQRA